jgi:hypothetical protein
MEGGAVVGGGLSEAPVHKRGMRGGRRDNKMEMDKAWRRCSPRRGSSGSVEMVRASSGRREAPATPQGSSPRSGGPPWPAHNEG